MPSSVVYHVGVPYAINQSPNEFRIRLRLSQRCSSYSLSILVLADKVHVRAYVVLFLHQWLVGGDPALNHLNLGGGNECAFDLM